MEFGISKQNLIDLFTNRRTDIIPSDDMSFDEKLDAASRFIGYAAALTFWRNPNSQSSLILLIVFVFLRWLKKTSNVPQNEEKEVKDNFLKNCLDKMRSGTIDIMPNISDKFERRDYMIMIPYRKCPKSWKCEGNNHLNFGLSKKSKFYERMNEFVSASYFIGLPRSCLAGGFHEDQANARAGELIKLYAKNSSCRFCSIIY